MNSFARLVSKLQGLGVPAARHLAPSASQLRVEQAQHETGLVFPSSLCALYLQHDGAVVPGGDMHGQFLLPGLAFHPIDEALASYQSTLGVDEAFYPAHRWPIMTGFGADVVAVDCDAGSRVVMFDVVEPTLWVFDSLDAFFDLQSDAVDAGVIRVDGADYVGDEIYDWMAQRGVRVAEIE